MLTSWIKHQPIGVLLAWAVGVTAAAGADDAPRQPPVPPERPEWVAMLGDILQGSQLGPGEGWFRTAVAQTRFTWDATQARYDRDNDGTITPAEWGGSAADFARLDRNRSGDLTAADFDFTPHALAPSPGAQLFFRADRDSNGKVTREEFEAVWRALDSNDLGFVSQDELRAAFNPPAPRRLMTTVQPAGPSRWTLVKGLFRQEIGSLQPGPALNEPAPDFSLRTVTGAEEVRLSQRVGPKPVVLIFGNFTCGPFRSQAGNVEKLFRRYGDRATFLMVYVREAHPTDGWAMESNDRVGVALRQPRTDAERIEVAQTCSQTLQLGMPMLVDSIDDTVGARYSGMPARLYLIDRAGKVAYKSGRGPFGFKPAELEQSLILLLDQIRAEDQAPPPTPPQHSSP